MTYVLPPGTMQRHPGLTVVSKRLKSFRNIATLKDFNSLTPETKIAEFENSVDLDEVAHDEPPHLDLHCLPFSL